GSTHHGSSRHGSSHRHGRVSPDHEEALLLLQSPQQGVGRLPRGSCKSFPSSPKRWLGVGEGRGRSAPASPVRRDDEEIEEEWDFRPDYEGDEEDEDWEEYGGAEEDPSRLEASEPDPSWSWEGTWPQHERKLEGLPSLPRICTLTFTRLCRRSTPSCLPLRIR